MHAPPVLTAELYNSQDVETTEMSTNREINKEYVVHVYHGIFPRRKNVRNNAICSNVDKPRDCHTG